MAGESGYCTKAIIDLHRFLVAKQMMDEDATDKMQSPEVSDIKTVVSLHSNASARATLIFKSNARLRSNVLVFRVPSSNSTFAFCLQVWHSVAF